MAELVTKTDLAAAIDAQTLRLTIRLGTIMVAGIAILAAILELIP